MNQKLTYEPAYIDMVTGEWKPEPATDEEARRLIPQDRASQGIYGCRRDLGDSILEALAYTGMAYLNSLEGK